jgi:hypothetical protein
MLLLLLLLLLPVLVAFAAILLLDLLICTVIGLECDVQCWARERQKSIRIREKKSKVVETRGVGDGCYCHWAEYASSCPPSELLGKIAVVLLTALFMLLNAGKGSQP